MVDALTGVRDLLIELRKICFIRTLIKISVDADVNHIVRRTSELALRKNNTLL